MARTHEGSTAAERAHQELLRALTVERFRLHRKTRAVGESHVEGTGEAIGGAVRSSNPRSKS